MSSSVAGTSRADVFLVFTGDLIDEKTYSNCLATLDAQRIKAIKRKVRKEDAHNSLVGDLLIRYMFFQRHGVILKNMDVFHNVYGKPTLNEHKQVHFNISHSGDWVVGIIGNVEVGIDIEEIKNIDLEHMEFLLSPGELDQYRSRQQNNAKEYFYKVWTYKESYLKMKGYGLNADLTLIDTTGALLKSDISFKEYNNINGYKMTVCAMKKGVEFSSEPIYISTEKLFSSHLKLNYT